MVTVQLEPVFMVGPISKVIPRQRAPRPPRGLFERTVILDVGPLYGAMDNQLIAYFRALPSRKERAVTFRLEEVKAMNTRPGLYHFRIKVPVDPNDPSLKDVVLVRPGEPIPGSKPASAAATDLRI